MFVDFLKYYPIYKYIYSSNLCLFVCMSNVSGAEVGHCLDTVHGIERIEGRPHLHEEASQNVLDQCLGEDNAVEVLLVVELLANSRLARRLLILGERSSATS